MTYLGYFFKSLYLALQTYVSQNEIITMLTYFDFLKLPIVRMDILGNTVKNSVLFQNMGTAANKAAYVQDHNAILLLDARVNKTASLYIQKN